MSSKFYSSIIEKEKGGIIIDNKALETAARSVSISYSERSLKKGSTYLDYDVSANRCAYMYKYSALHTGIVIKYFRKLSRKKDVRKILSSKGKIKICSLGGEPGSDIVGICKALAVNPLYKQRIKQVSVLDISQGWENTFEYIMTELVDGKIEGIPDNFINKVHFKKEFIRCDLLASLSENIMNTISNADIICMVKFVSVILAKPQSDMVLKRLVDSFKKGATIFFVDNLKGNIYESIGRIFEEKGLETSFASVNENFVRPTKCEMEMYGCRPQCAARFSVAGWIKRTTVNIDYLSDEIYDAGSENAENIVSWMENTSDEESDLQFSLNETHNYAEQHTQTTEIAEELEVKTVGEGSSEFLALVETFVNLSEVLIKLQRKPNLHKCCCQFH